jgi:hypothetical protein
MTKTVYGAPKQEVEEVIVEKIDTSDLEQHDPRI